MALYAIRDKRNDRKGVAYRERPTRAGEKFISYISPDGSGTTYHVLERDIERIDYDEKLAKLRDWLKETLEIYNDKILPKFVEAEKEWDHAAG